MLEYKFKILVLISENQREQCSEVNFSTRIIYRILRTKTNMKSIALFICISFILYLQPKLYDDYDFK